MVEIPRRAVLIGTAVAPLAACAKAVDGPAAAPQAVGQVLASTADIPVGSGKIVDGTLITQPSAGVFKGFSARCTHAGCALSEVTDGNAVCRCHGSRFTLEGAVARGPATEPLVARPITVRGGEVITG